MHCKILILSYFNYIQNMLRTHGNGKFIGRQSLQVNSAPFIDILYEAQKAQNVKYYRGFRASTKPKTPHELSVLRANTQMKFGRRYNTAKKNLRVKFHTPTLLLGRSSSRLKFPPLGGRSYLPELEFYLRIDSQIKVGPHASQVMSLSSSFHVDTVPN